MRAVQALVVVACAAVQQRRPVQPPKAKSLRPVEAMDGSLDSTERVRGEAGHRQLQGTWAHCGEDWHFVIGEDVDVVWGLHPGSQLNPIVSAGVRDHRLRPGGAREPKAACFRGSGAGRPRSLGTERRRRRSW